MGNGYGINSSILPSLVLGARNQSHRFWGVYCFPPTRRKNARINILVNRWVRLLFVPNRAFEYGIRLNVFRA